MIFYLSKFIISSFPEKTAYSKAVFPCLSIYAVQFRNVEAVKVLLQNKADKTKIDKQGKTAFEYAVFSGNEEIINLLK